MFSRQLSGFFVPLFLMSSLAYADDCVIKVTSENFESLIGQTDKVVIIDVYATWCPPCKLLKPIFHDFASKNTR